MKIFETILGWFNKAQAMVADAQQIWDAFEAAQKELKQGPVKEQVALAMLVVRKYLP